MNRSAAGDQQIPAEPAAHFAVESETLAMSVTTVRLRFLEIATNTVVVEGYGIT
jgi:hypothetical protein